MALNQVAQRGLLGGHRQVQGAQPLGPLANVGLQMAQNANPGQGLNLGHAPPVWLRGAPPQNPLHGLQPANLPQLPPRPVGGHAPPQVQGGSAQQGEPVGPQPGANANQAQAPQPTGHVIAASKAAIKALNKAAQPDAQHGVSDSSRLLDWATLEAEKGRKMSGKTATAIREGLEAFKQGAQAQVGGGPNRRAQDVAALKGHLDHTMTLLDRHIANHTKGEAAMVSLKNQLTTYKALLDQIGTDGPAPGTRPTYMDMLKTRAFDMPDSALAQIATHGRQGVQDLGHLGSGAVNSTRLVQYQGEPAPMVFKPMHAVSSGASGMEQAAGIDLNNPRFANRNVATTLAARDLGLSQMVPRTQFAAVGGQVGIAMEKLGGFALSSLDSQRIALSDADQRQVELQEKYLEDGRRAATSKKDSYTPANFAYTLKSMNIVIDQNGNYGKEVHAAYKLNTTDPKFLKQVNDAEWLHALTGELDANSGNMRVELQAGPNGSVTQQLKLFDFDFSFGQNVHDPTTIQTANSRHALPPVVSQQTYDAFTDLAANWNAKKQAYAELLSPAEMSAMEIRLFGGQYTDANGAPQQAKGIMPHFQDLAANNRVIQNFATWQGDDPPGSGAQVDAVTLMRTDATANNGYLEMIEALAQDGRDKRAAVGL